MPKTKCGAVPRKNVRIPTPLMDEVDGIVQDCGLYVNRQQFIESAIREKVENFKFSLGKSNKMGCSDKAIKEILKWYL